ncbi:hypothetical protein ES708_26090 [subsurface metagenome]
MLLIFTKAGPYHIPTLLSFLNIIPFPYCPPIPHPILIIEGKMAIPFASFRRAPKAPLSSDTDISFNTSIDSLIISDGVIGAACTTQVKTKNNNSAKIIFIIFLSSIFNFPSIIYGQNIFYKTFLLFCFKLFYLNYFPIKI